MFWVSFWLALIFFMLWSVVDCLSKVVRQLERISFELGRKR